LFTDVLRLLGYAKTLSNNLQNRSVVTILGWEHYAAGSFIWCKQVTISQNRNRCVQEVFIFYCENL